MSENTPTTDFTLINYDGTKFTLSSNKGKVVLLFFGFTYCPDVCPLTLSTWKKTADQLGNDVEKVEFVYITVDPERDSAEKLKSHLSIFNPDFKGLTGDQEALNDVYNAYGIIREKQEISESAAGYLINHTARINIIDPAGQWRLTYSHDTPAEDLVHDIRLLLKNNQS